MFRRSAVRPRASHRVYRWAAGRHEWERCARPIRNARSPELLGLGLGEEEIGRQVANTKAALDTGDLMAVLIAGGPIITMCRAAGYAA